MEMSDKTAATTRIFTGKFSVIRKKMLWDTQNRNEVQACGKLGKIYSVLSFTRDNRVLWLFNKTQICMNYFLPSRTLEKEIYTLFDGFTDNTRGYLRVASYFSEPRRGEEKCEQRVKCPRVLSVKPSNKRFIIPLHSFPVIFDYFIQ